MYFPSPIFLGDLMPLLRTLRPAGEHHIHSENYDKASASYPPGLRIEFSPEIGYLNRHLSLISSFPGCKMVKCVSQEAVLQSFYSWNI
jgi:hypothetical protein